MYRNKRGKITQFLSGNPIEIRNYQYILANY